MGAGDTHQTQMQTASGNGTYASRCAPAFSFNRKDSLKERLGVQRVGHDPVILVLDLDIRGPRIS